LYKHQESVPVQDDENRDRYRDEYDDQQSDGAGAHPLQDLVLLLNGPLHIHPGADVTLQLGQSDDVHQFFLRGMDTGQVVVIPDE